MGSQHLLTVARWLFLIYVASLPLVQPFSQRLHGYLFVYSDLIFAAAAGAWSVGVFLGKIPVKWHRVFGWVGVFLLAMTLAAGASVEPDRSFLKLSGVFYLAAVAWLAFNLTQDERFLRSITLAWLAGTCLTLLGAFLGIAGFYAGFDSTSTNRFLFHFGSLPTGNYPRIDSFFDNANMMANYLNVSVALALAAAAAGWVTERKAILLALLIVGVSIFTFSAGLGGIILSIAIFLGLGRFRQTRFTRKALLLGGLSIAILGFATTLISPVQRENQFTLNLPFLNIRLEPSVRVVVWANAIERGSEFPFLGRGTGLDAANVQYVVASGHTQALRDAHQAWLNIFGQAGSVGLTAFIFICWGILRACTFEPGSETEAEWLWLGLTSAFIGAFLFQNLFGSFEDARHLWVLIGLLPAAETLVYTKRRHSDAPSELGSGS